jgi:hypothetical protein
LRFNFPAVASSPNAKTVISTEAAHSLIVSSAVEKSASLPKLSLSHCAVAVFICLQKFASLLLQII